MKEQTTIEQTLKVMLTDAELLSIGYQLADRNAELDALENNLKSVSTEFKMKIAAAESARSLLSSVMRSKYEYRPVKCSVTLGDPDPGRKTVVRNDTGEVVSISTMTPEELQRKMNFDAEAAQERTIGPDGLGLVPLPTTAKKIADEIIDDIQLAEAVQVFKAEGKVSIPLLQRRMKISLVRASQILSTLVAREAVTPANGDEPQRLVDGPEAKGKK